MTIDSASRVLVVDDEPGIRTALRANFLRHGWQVETASCVREANRILEVSDFDLSSAMSACPMEQAWR
jgi:DNA-binding NtrC family response regulator